jgi:peptide/nickel transport system substrate-binding protein
MKVLAPSVAARIIALWPNLRVAPVNSLRVREALSLAADRPRMVEQIALGQATTARAPIASTSPYFDATLPEMKRDVAEANRLLDAAGLKRGSDGVRFTLRLLHVATFQDFARTAAILKENLEEVGIRVNIVAGELTTTLDAIFKNWDFDVAVYSGLMGPEPGVRWLAWFTGEGINRAYFTNATGYQNRRVDRLVKESTSIVDKTKRTATYREIQRIIMSDLPMIPLWEPKFISAYRAELENAFLQPDELYINFARTWFRGR